MSTATLNNKKIESSFKRIIKSLSAKERNVIEKRVGLGGKERLTLQSIGNSFSPNITRERVRQIEDSGIKKIGRIIKSSDLAIIQDTARKYIELHGGMLGKDIIINNLIKDLSLGSDINSYVVETIIQADYEILKSKPRLGTQTYFYFPFVTKQLVDEAYKEGLKILKKKKDVVNKLELYEQIKHNLNKPELSITFIDSVMNIFDDIVIGEENLIGLAKWKILNPKTLKDKAIYVMKKEKLPMHFVDISNKITEFLGDKVKVNTIHNELIRNPEFVLIGRGLYALKEWGFKPGTVIDVIADILDKSGEPMSTEDIIKGVLKVRNVKKTTIYMNLQNKKVIERVGRNFYTLKK
ncbi:MAG: sigma factor-like helix-turn-helix DNA-binding protein [Candidatus Gracilibacteria bacterium]|nr:sigma factor-like helix-turn-helix DNA-binding protein [Candidatus Gracilibacteria bacterium]